MTKVTEYKVKVFENGTIEWYDLEGRLHKEDGPAVVSSDGFRAWHKHGELHRTDGAAVSYSDGSEEWFIDGKHPLWYQKQQLNAVADFCYENKLYSVIRLIEDLLSYRKVELNSELETE